MTVDTSEKSLEQSLIRIVMDAEGTETVGTGFVVADHLAVTCAHVVLNAKSDCDLPVYIQFFGEERTHIAHVLQNGWSSERADDVAFIQFDPLPAGIKPVVLGSAKNSDGHRYVTLGYASPSRDYRYRKFQDTIEGLVSVVDRRPTLQLKGELVDKGLSGAPVFDIQTKHVVGMVNEYLNTAYTRIAWATTSDTLQSLNPSLYLWPDTYGPGEISVYLEKIIEEYQTLTLPLARDQVLLERIYVSLCADEMSRDERLAEQLYLDDRIAEAQQVIKDKAINPYVESDLVHKVIIRYPTMLMLLARDWARLFSERTSVSVSVAEVLQRHLHVVMLGDPGSGKTTLGKWIVLQHARALRQGQAHVEVPVDAVRPDAQAEDEDIVDLGPTRLPIFIRIATFFQWVRAKQREGRKLFSLKEFIEGDDCAHWQEITGLSKEMIQALRRNFLSQGQALIVLDGLDEVNDPLERREVMLAVRTFLRRAKDTQKGEEGSLEEEKGAENHVLLTSRIVGYQLDPLVDLPHYIVEGMTDTAIAAFCQAWMYHVAKVDPEEAKQQAENLKSAIFDHAHSGVRVMATNPLLLTILAQIYRDNPQRGLPTTRVALFDEATQAFYAQRKDFWEQAAITSQQLTRALGAVASHIHSCSATGFIEEGEVRAQLDNVLVDSDQVEMVLKAAREVSGFLVARGEGVYGFLHRAIQEYFVAVHLTGKAGQMIESLAAYLLNPTWREPLVLAVGIVSQRRYPNSREYLLKAFETILNTPDPVSEVLPSREFLTAAACRECERIPEGVGRQIAERLLVFYQEGKGRGKSPVLRIRIQSSFRSLRNSPADEEAETVLCEAVQDHDFERRYAGVDLIIETRWDTPALASALISSWCIYADPAATLLTALVAMRERRPEVFQKIQLPMRQLANRDVQLWERVANNPVWQAIVRALYLLPEDDFRPDNIYRDSPLTPQVEVALRQSLDSTALERFRQYLIPLAGQPGTALARDAALALTALGDASWVEASLMHANEQRFQIRSIVASLTFIDVSAFDFGSESDFDSYQGSLLSIIFKPGFDLESVFELLFGLSSAPDFDSESALQTLAKVLDHDSASKLASALANLKIPNRKHPLSRTLDFNFDLSLANVLTQALTHTVARIPALDRSLNNAYSLARGTFRTMSLAPVHALAYVLTYDLDLAYEEARAQIRTLDLDLAYRSLDIIMKLIKAAQLRWANDVTIISHLDSALVAVPRLQGLLDEQKAVRGVLEALLIGSRRHWFQLQEDLKSEIVAEQSQKQVSSEEMVTLVEDLASPDDMRRENAREVLLSVSSASKIGRSVVEQIAKLAHIHRANPQVGTWLEWTLSSIIHDEPSWISDWVKEASEGEDGSPAEMILYSLHEVTPNVLDQMLVQLSDTKSEIKLALLESLSWLVRLKHTPVERQDALLEQLLLQLSKEQDERIRAAIIEVLGQWRKAPKDLDRIGNILLERLHDPTWAIDAAPLYVALARLASHQQSLTKAVRASLQESNSQPSAAAALVRLMLASASDNAREIRLVDFLDLPKLNYTSASRLLTTLADILPDTKRCLDALLEAGTDNDPWNDDYHGILVVAAKLLLQRYPDLLGVLLTRLQSALEQQDWEPRRITLATVAACAEVMPMTLQRAAQGKLEDLLIRGATDAESLSSRRFALTAISYLRTVTAAIVPALLAGCQDNEWVQRDAIAATSRFQEIKGNPLPDLVEALMGESVSTANAVAHLLAALGTSAAGQSANVHGQSVEALVNALKQQNSQREVFLFGFSLGKLEDTLYESLLKISLWEI